MNDSPVVRLFRDAKLMEIGAGTSRDPADADRAGADGEGGVTFFQNYVIVLMIDI